MFIFTAWVLQMYSDQISFEMFQRPLWKQGQWWWEACEYRRQCEIDAAWTSGLYCATTSLLDGHDYTPPALKISGTASLIEIDSTNHENLWATRCVCATFKVLQSFGKMPTTRQCSNLRLGQNTGSVSLQYQQFAEMFYLYQDHSFPCTKFGRNSVEFDCICTELWALHSIASKHLTYRSEGWAASAMCWAR